MTLSVALITLNEEKKLGATLESVKWADEIIVVDSGSTDRTLEIARAYGARIFSETWKGFSSQKNSSIAKATCDWVLSLDADEAVEPELAREIRAVINDNSSDVNGYFIPRKNILFGRWIKHGGWYPDPKLRLFRRGAGWFVERPVHESMAVKGRTAILKHALVHNAYLTISDYIAANNNYTSLGAQHICAQGRCPGFSLIHLVLNPLFTFVKNYCFRLGFLDGKEGFILHVNHSVQVFWKYAKAWELTRKAEARCSMGPRCPGPARHDDN
jgi:glycosyltransferase involved in cell wall biosynthesis